MIDVKNFSILKKKIKEKVSSTLYDNGVENWIIKEFEKKIDDSKGEKDISDAVNDFANSHNPADKPIINYTFIRDEFVKEGVDIHEWKPERYFQIVNFKEKFMPKLFADDLVKEFSFISTNEKTPEIYLYDNEEGIYKLEGINFIDRFTTQFLGTLKNKNILNEIVMFVKSMTYHDRDIFEKTDKSLLCLSNGVYDVRINKLLMHSPSMIFLNNIPIRFNPKAECPKIKQFLKEVLLEEDLNITQELFGYVLYRSNLFKKAFILLGEKDAGKSTFLNVLINLIGVHNKSGVALQKLGDRFSSYHLYGKHLNVVDDLDFRDVTNTGMFKMAIGESYINCEMKHGSQFQFINFAKLVFATNKIALPKDVDDDAYYSRWFVLRFQKEFTDENNTIKRNLTQELITTEELEGLLLYALEGLKRLLDNQKFSRLQSVDEVKLIMHRSGSSIASFVIDKLEECSNYWVSKEEMFEAYSQYTKECELVNKGINKLGRDLPLFATYVLDSKQGNKTGWRNVKIKGSHVLPDEDF